MSDSRWNATIAFGETVDARGLKLVTGVAEKGPWADATVVPAEIGGSPCHRTAPTGKPRKQMGYWRNENEDAEGTADAFLLAVESPKLGMPEVYVTIEFYETEIGWLGVHFLRADGGTGRRKEPELVHHVCPPDRRGSWDPTWVNTADTNSWQTATIKLVFPIFPHKGPFGSDIRIVSSGPLYIRRVTLSEERPANFSETDQMGHARRIEELLAPRFPKANAAISIGNIGGILEEHDDVQVKDVPPWLPIHKAMGITALQSYVRWSTIERKEGVWDWSFYDWVVDEGKRFGLKWVAFIMIGPWYAMPKWWLATGENMRNKCLEHGEESWVQSVWNPTLLGWVDRFMEKFAEHYPEEIIESIMVGISGDFGESTTNGVFIEGLYHTHVGKWCGEPAAIADFRRSMAAKYGEIGKLNATWGAHFGSFDEVAPVLFENRVSDRMWVDETAWFTDRMTWWMQKWGEICRKALPNTVLYNAAGGAGDPARTAHWTDQSRALAATSGMGQRVTNEGADYAFNFVYTAWPGHCCRHYGIPFGNEPWGGDMCGTGDLGRMYNAITMSAKNYWFYEGHIRPPAGRLALERALPFMEGTYARKNRLAVWYPWTHFVLEDEHGFSERGMRDRYWPQVEEFRDVFDYDFLDDGLMKDGAGKNFDFLVILQGAVYEKDELARIVAWVEAGGVLITHNIGTPATIDGDTALGRKLFAFPDAVTDFEKRIGGRIATVGNGRVVFYPRSADVKGWHGDPRWDKDHKDHPATRPELWRMVSDVLANASKLGNGLADYPVVDGALDEVYGALVDRTVNGKTEPGILYFSQTKEDVTVHPVIPGVGRGEAVVPAGRIAFVPFSRLK